MAARKAVFAMLLSSLVTARLISSTVRNAALLRKPLTWGRESSRQVQDPASKLGGGEQKLSSSPETSSQLQRCEMARYREERTPHWIGILPF